MLRKTVEEIQERTKDDRENDSPKREALLSLFERL